MKVAHWTKFNKSGMNRVAESIQKAERTLGVDSIIVNLDNQAVWPEAEDADIHVSHTHFPENKFHGKEYKLVYVPHGTPEHVFMSSVIEGESGRYGHGDGWMLLQHWLKVSDAIVTFWPRHRDIFRTLVDKRTIVDLAPLGIDKGYWVRVPSPGKYAGEPSCLSCENPHFIKWPMDLCFLWPWVSEEMPDAVLHLSYLATNMHRWFFPLVNANGTSYAAHISARYMQDVLLRDVLCSIDYYLSFVRYGDFNRMSLEAAACGCPVISYYGNPYATYWVSEGDQRVTAMELIRIFRGEVEPRVIDPIPDVVDTAKAMISVYERILQ
jgi:hypothetical protein